MKEKIHQLQSVVDMYFVGIAFNTGLLQFAMNVHFVGLLRDLKMSLFYTIMILISFFKFVTVTFIEVVIAVLDHQAL
jgi:hypothetical protein